MLLLVTLAACGTSDAIDLVDDARLSAADRDSANWLTYGRTYNEQRFSPLRQVNDSTVRELGLVWSQELPTTRGVEATPIVVDGVIYTTSAWSVVYAFDAITGRATLDVRSESRSLARSDHLLRRGEPRPRAVSRQAVSRHTRRSPRRHRGAHRSPGVGRDDRRPVEAVRHHRCAAHREGPRAHRQRRRRVRRAWLRVGIRRRDGEVGVARVLGTGGSGARVRIEGARSRGEDVAR